jgi:hypothetical protein
MQNNSFDDFNSSEIFYEDYPSLGLDMKFDSAPHLFQNYEDFENLQLNYITEEESKDLETLINKNKELQLKDEKDEDIKNIGESKTKEQKIKFTSLPNPNNTKKEIYRFRYDDEIQKMKGYFLKSLLNFLNYKYNKIIKLNLNIIYWEFLKKIKYEYYRSTKKEDNLLFLKLKIKELFSQEISGYYSEENKNFNKQNINNLLLNYNNIKGSNELYDILENKTVEDMLNSYAKGDYKEEGFYLENDLDIIKQKSKKKEGVILEKYIETLRKNVKNFRKIFEEKSGRNKFSKKYK